MSPARPTNDRESILGAAVSEFLKRGYDATRVEHIAEAASLSKSSVYHHVAGKEELLRLGLDRALAGLATCFRESEAAGASRYESLTRLIELVLADMLDPARMPYVALLIGVHGNSPVEQHAIRQRRDYDRRLAELIQDCQDGGRVRDDVPAIVLARLVFGTINSLQWVRPEPARQNSTIQRHALGYITSALETARSRP